MSGGRTHLKNITYAADLRTTLGERLRILLAHLQRMYDETLSQI
jgi:hypothetical protein